MSLTQFTREVKPRGTLAVFSVDAVRDRFDMANLEIRCRDYYRDFEELTGTNAAVISYGGTNELPGIPESGLGIEGYSEIGRRVWYDGKIVAAW